MALFVNREKELFEQKTHYDARLIAAAITAEINVTTRNKVNERERHAVIA
jgi:hypothetical protein